MTAEFWEQLEDRVKERIEEYERREACRSCTYYTIRPRTCMLGTIPDHMGECNWHIEEFFAKRLWKYWLWSYGE